MKTAQTSKISKKTVFVFKSVKSNDNFKTDPTTATSIVTISAL